MNVNSTQSTQTQKDTMEYHVTLQVPDALIARVNITDMSEFANRTIKEALEREAQKNMHEEERDYQRLAMLEAQRGKEDEEEYSLSDAKEVLS